jgi:nuclear protein localization family protein 4
LKDDGTSQGKVLHKRHLNSFFLTAQECLLAGTLQLQFPYKTPFSETNEFGSRFITCIASGNKEGGVEIEAYQVSNECLSLVKNDLIQPTFHPNHMMLRNIPQKPTLQYRYVDKYGNAVSEIADPHFPIEYMLVTLSHGFPQISNPWFKAQKYFNIENRITEPQEPSILREYFNAETLFYDLSNLHVIMFLFRMSLLDDETLKLICLIAKDPENEAAMQLLNSPGWQTFEMLIKEY